MITNELINRIGPGPAAYDYLSALKKVISNKWKGPVIKKPSELDDRVRMKLNVSTSRDTSKQKQ